MYSVLLDGKAGPFDLVVLQNVVCKGHAQLLIERHGFFICNEIEGNVLFAAGQFMRRSHELGADSPAFVISIYAQIGDIKPIQKSVRPNRTPTIFPSSLCAARLMEAF